MKKTFILSFSFVIFGFICGFLIYKSHTESILSTFNEGRSYYFLQEGAYSSYEIMTENIKTLDTKLIEQDGSKYYVYVGITQDEKIAEKLKQIYESMGYQLYIKQLKLSSEEFYNNVVQFDLLINNASKDSEILTIEQVVLANYEEIIKNDK